MKFSLFLLSLILISCKDKAIDTVKPVIQSRSTYSNDSLYSITGELHRKCNISDVDDDGWVIILENDLPVRGIFNKATVNADSVELSEIKILNGAKFDLAPYAGKEIAVGSVFFFEYDTMLLRSVGIEMTGASLLDYSTLSIDRLNDLNFKECENKKFFLPNAYDVIKELPTNVKETSMISDELQKNGFTLTSANSGNWIEGPRFTEFALEKKGCKCYVLKQYIYNNRLTNGNFDLKITEELFCKNK